MKKYLIYKHTSPSGKSYIGQTNDYNRRCNKHKTTSGCVNFYNAIQKYGWDNFKHEILISGLTLEQANKYEEFYISEHNTLAPNGYNLKTGGHNNNFSTETKQKMSITATKNMTNLRKQQIRKSRLGTTQSLETRLKKSKSLTGRKMSLESVFKSTQAKIGRKRSPETNKKNSLNRLGKPRTEETKQKIKQNWSDRKLNNAHVSKDPRCIKILIDNNIYGSVKEASLLLNLPVSTIRARLKSVKCTTYLVVHTISNFCNLEPTVTDE